MALFEKMAHPLLKPFGYRIMTMLEKKDPSREIAALKQDNTRLSFALHGTKNGIWDWNLQTQNVFFDENFFKIADYAPNEFVPSYENWKNRVHPDDLTQAEDRINACLSGASQDYSAEFRFKTKTDDWMWIRGQGRVFEYDHQGNPLRFTGTHHDINDRKRAEQALKIAYETLEEKVRERTAELEKMNTALTVLLKKGEQDRQDIEEKILANFKLRVSPALDRLKQAFAHKTEYPGIELLEQELADILSGFSKKLSHPLAGLTPTEIQIASMIKQGKSNKDIATLLDRSAHTIANHRENIRKKLGLKNQKINLRSHLTTL
jgi:PAS domain S-box-containing protein